MLQNLQPSFIMREGGANVNDIPKIHMSESASNDYCIHVEIHGLQVPLFFAEGLFLL